MAEHPNDGFESYFTEKLWEMVPAVYRQEDGLAENREVLRAFIEIIAEQAAIMRRSHDRLWEDQFIELCQDWAIPYLGDLVATRLVSALNKRGRRIDVAKTIYYRRRKGTLRVLEELISDIAGWEGKVVEHFKGLARTRHGLDPCPVPHAGRFSGTLPGGLADLRSARAALLNNSGFGEFHHTADVRQHRGLKGRHNIPKLAFYLYRLCAFRVEGVTPFALDDGLRFTCDPSGRDTPLFMPRRRPENWDEWRSSEEWELPAPISCHLLGHEEYDDAGNLLEDCGKQALIPNAVRVEEASGVEVSAKQTVAGCLIDWKADVSGNRLVIDPKSGRFKFLGNEPAGPVIVTYHYGFSGEIGAGTYSRPKVERREPTAMPNLNARNSGGTILSGHIDNKGITQIDDSATYSGIGDKLQVQNLTLQARSQQRPYIRLNSNWVLRTLDNGGSKLMLDGIWLGSKGNFAVILRGVYKEVIIRNATFDPGGSRDVNDNLIWPVQLIVEAHIERLVIDSCIMSCIAAQNGGMVENLEVRDSILDATDSTKTALKLHRGEVKLNRVTVFGEIDANRLWASEALITGVVDVTDTQKGCFRFSAAPAASRLPRRYEAHDLDDAAHIFTSRCFGQPGYGQLSETAPLELRRGAENTSEMGAFSNLNNSIKIDSLNSKIEEYMPFGFIPIFIQET